MDLTDPQTRVAAQLAKFRPRTRGIIQDEPVAMRKQHGHSAAPIRRDFRLFGRTNDPSQDQEPEKSVGRRVQRDFQTVLRGPGRGPKDFTYQSYARDATSVLELDPPRIHIRNKYHRPPDNAGKLPIRGTFTVFYAQVIHLKVPGSSGVPEYHLEMLSGDRLPGSRSRIRRQVRHPIHHGHDRHQQNDPSIHKHC